MSTLNFNCTRSVLFVRLELHYMNVKPFWIKWTFIAWLDMLRKFLLHCIMVACQPVICISVHVRVFHDFCFCRSHVTLLSCWHVTDIQFHFLAFDRASPGVLWTVRPSLSYRCISWRIWYFCAYRSLADVWGCKQTKILSFAFQLDR